MTSSHSRAGACTARMVGAAIVAIAATMARAQPSFTVLGDLPTGSEYSVATAISADGATVVGAASVLLPGNTENTMQAFRWTRTDGMVSLGAVPGFTGDSEATGVSRDGSVIVGYIQATQDWQSQTYPFIWSADQGIRELPVLANRTGGQAIDVSESGTKIAGWCGSGPYPIGWAVTEPFSLGGLNGSSTGRTYAISGNGTTIVGQSSSSQAFRWREQTGMQIVGELPGGYNYSVATAVSADGSAIAGMSSSERFPDDIWMCEAFLWTQERGFGGLNFRGYPQAISADGSIIAGWNYTTSPHGGAFVFRRSVVFRLYRYLQWYRIDEGEIEGWSFGSVSDMTPDGRTFVGSARGPDNRTLAYMASVGQHCLPDWNDNGVVDSQDLFDFLADFFDGNADYNVNGVTDGIDWFFFLEDWRFRYYC